MMQPGHEDCAAARVDSFNFANFERTATVWCHHEHKDPIVIDPDLSPETVGWHCHCCGRVWVDETYVKGPRP